MSELQMNSGHKSADPRLLETVALVKRGDEQAFEELYRLTFKYAYFHARSILHDDDEAWDLVQEVYIAVYRNIGSLKEDRYVKSWISGIVFNLGMKRLRKQRDLLLDKENDFLFDALEDESADGSPERALDSKETAAIVQEVIDRLPALQKAAVIAYYFDEKSVAAIAEDAMCSENTIKSRLNYARKAMKDAIEQKERQMGVKLHVVTGPMIVFVLKGMFNDMSVSGQKARYVWMGIQKGIQIAGAAAGTAGGASGASAGTTAAGTAGGASGSSAGTTATGTASGASAGGGSAGAASSSAAAAGKTGAAAFFGTVKVKTVAVILTAALAVGGAAGVAIGTHAVKSNRQTVSAEDSRPLSPDASATSGRGDIPADTAPASEDMSDGWKHFGDISKYVENGEYVCHTWKDINGALLYFDRNGRMVDDSISLGRQTFTFDADGVLTGIYAADAGNECSVYYDEDICYRLENGQLIREDENGRSALYSGPETIKGFTVSENTAACFTDKSLLLVSTDDGSILMERDLNPWEPLNPLSLDWSDSVLYMSTLSADGKSGDLSKFIDFTKPSDTLNWDSFNYSDSYSPEFYKIQAVDGETYFLRSNRYPTTDGVEFNGYRLCRSGDFKTTVLFDNVDEFFIFGDRVYYMTNDSLFAMSLSLVNDKKAEQNRQALAAYREKLTEYASVFSPLDGAAPPIYPTGFHVLDLNQDGILEVLVDFEGSFADSYCELLYYNYDHLEQARLMQGCNTVNEENGLIISTIFHQDYNGTVYQFDGYGVKEVATLAFDPYAWQNQNPSSVAYEYETLMENLQQWDLSCVKLVSSELDEAAYDLVLSGDGACTGRIPSTLIQDVGAFCTTY